MFKEIVAVDSRELSDISWLNWFFYQEMRLIARRSHSCGRKSPRRHRRHCSHVPITHRHPTSIDNISRVIFPFIFFTFNIFYWAVYLQISAGPDISEFTQSWSITSHPVCAFSALFSSVQERQTARDPQLSLLSLIAMINHTYRLFQAPYFFLHYY